MTARARDHGGGIDAAVARWGGTRADWMDLSTGINPVPWPVPALPAAVWQTLPDRGAQMALEEAARTFWAVPDRAAVLATPGASAPIAQLPYVLAGTRVSIRPDTYNEHAAAFRAAGWTVDGAPAPLSVVVHPDNPTGDFADPGRAGAMIVDESFCDTAPVRSMMHRAGPGVTILKSFGKFWGLAGLRLGFAMGDPAVIEALRARLGPWPVSGPALALGTAALGDGAWAARTRDGLHRDAERLDSALGAVGLHARGACPLFRLVHTDDAQVWHRALAERRILTRVFPSAPDRLRIGLPPPDLHDRLVDALDGAARDVHGTTDGRAAQPDGGRRR